MEGFLPSSMEDNVNFTSNQFDLQSLLSELDLLSPPPEVPVNQSFMLCNDHVGQNMVVDNNVINDSIQQTTVFPPSFPQTMTTMGGLNGTSSSWINQNEPNWPQTEPNQPGHDYMTPNATTSQHGGFIQPEPSFPPLRSPFLSNQGQDDQAAVIPNIDYMQQENFVPRHFGNSTRSHMDNLQVRGLQNQTARPNASNHGLGTSLQSQNRGLNTQQVEMVGSNDPFWNYVEDGADDGSMKCMFCPHTYAIKTSISRIKWHLSGERGHNVAICRGVTNEVQEAAFLAMCGGNKRHKITASSINVNDSGISTCPQEQNIEINMVGGIGSVQREVQVVEPEVGEERISSHAIAGNDEVSSNSEDDLQVTGLQIQTARPNASNPGLDTSLQSQIKGLNTQQVEMVGSKDPFWNYIEDRADGSTKCKFCPHTFANKTSISRIKWHLSGEEGHNVAICSGVTKEVQEAAFLAMCGGNKRHKITESSINIINYCGISTCPEEQNIEINMGGGIGRVQREVQVVEPRGGEERISSHAIARNNEVSMTGMSAHEDRVSKEALEIRLRTDPVDRALEQSSAVLGNLAGGAGRIQVGVQGMEQGPGEERIQSHLQAENGIENTGEGSFQHDAFETIPKTEQVQLLEPRGDSSQFGLDIGGCYDQPCAPSVNNDVTIHDEQDMVRVRIKPVKEEEDVENSGRSVVQAGKGARSSESLKYNNTRGVPLPTSSSKPVGQAFKENTKVIWSLLMDNEVPTIGIYGMGGVGKTTILQHIHNELLQRPDICDHVWWVTVSQDFSINRLQNGIAKHLDLDLSREADDLHRVAKLSEELVKRQKWILILDDLWNNFELQEVGIPVSLKGCKLIMTTRSETICHRMACQHKIKVKPLSEGEAWTLFMEKLGHDIALSPEIAKAIARECAGLPLGISMVAGSLRGVNDLHEWSNTLKKLKESEFRDKKVFKLLRFSYDRVGDLALQQCLLYCALFPENHRIKRESLIGYLIDVGIIKGMRSRKDAFDEGHTMLNRLEYVCLLESAPMTFGGSRCVKMHDLIRDMAIQIVLENSQGMVKAGAQLKELPDAEEWTENLIIVSLMQNKIEEIPSSYSPRCPNLSTLFLCDNEGLGFIADSFFKQLNGLKVLDLSRTGIKNLPDSVSDLVSLTALLLSKCENLRHVPSLKKLRALKRLDLNRTALEKMPQGMECLTNLRYLRMNGCGEKEFPSGILPKLSHLQVFVLEEELIEQCYDPITVKGKEVGSLRNLETLECHFKGFSDFVEYLRSRDGIQSLSTYTISVGMVDYSCWENIDDFPSKTVGLGNLSINGDGDFQVKFLNGIQGLVCEFIDARSLCDVLSLENATELEFIDIRGCHNMESLVSSSWFCYAPPRLPSYNGAFSGLKVFCCDGCNNMKKLFPLVLLPNFVNLERIVVTECEKMEEIIGTTDEESSTSNSITEFILPKLRTLDLYRLPELKSICSAKLICNSLEDIHVTYCEKLKRMAICLPLLENGQPSPPPSLKNIYSRPEEWWRTVVEWEHPNAKDVLRPFVKFGYC